MIDLQQGQRIVYLTLQLLHSSRHDFSKKYALQIPAQNSPPIAAAGGAKRGKSAPILGKLPTAATLAPPTIPAIRIGMHIICRFNMQSNIQPPLGFRYRSGKL